MWSIKDKDSDIIKRRNNIERITKFIGRGSTLKANNNLLRVSRKY